MQNTAYTTLITVDQLKTLQRTDPPGASGLMVFDCSFDLMNPEAGEAAYTSAHIAGSGKAFTTRIRTRALSRHLPALLHGRISDVWADAGASDAGSR